MFTIVIPTYNKANTIGKAIESVYAQTCSDWEIIVVNDGSKDDFDGAIAPYESDPRIHVIHQQNAGVSVARNRGIEVAKGEYLAFLDADDEWKPNHLEVFQEMIEREPGAGVYMTPILIQYPDGSTHENTEAFERQGLWRETDIFAYIYRNGGRHILNILGACFLTAAVKKVGGFQPGERLGEDTDFSLHVAAYYDVVLMNVITSIYHREMSTATKEMGFLNYDWYFQKREQKLLADERIPKEKRFYIRALLDHFRIHKARHYLLEGMRKQAKDELKKVTWDPKKWRHYVTTWAMMLIPLAVLNGLYRLKRRIRSL